MILTKSLIIDNIISIVYCYEYPRPSVTVDIILLTDAKPYPDVLLIRRKNPPFKEAWALPGGFLEMDETLEESALRELYEETNISNVELTQLGTFDHPHRDPRGRVITVAYVGIVKSKIKDVIAGSDAGEATWHSTSKLPELAFDHKIIIQTALK
ncbi:NUDIX hydrolase [Candidatus Poribacteria bacterium]|nr:NUDIX hydrolase [Candidatus Poribacteria bacterium]